MTTRTAPSYTAPPGRRRPAPAGVTVEGATASYLLNCRARNLSAQTIGIYRWELGRLDGYLRDQGMPADVGLVRREHIEAYVLELQGRGLKPASVSMAFRVMRSFWRWLVEEDEIPASPMDRMRSPVVPADPPTILRKADMDALLDTVKGRSFDERRDRAIMLLLFDSGIRRGELVNLNVDDVDLRMRIARVRGKARVVRTVAFGDDVAEALDRYLRVRRSHPHASDPALWLGKKGRLGGSGVLTMTKRRGGEAGVRIHPHTLRHSWAHSMLSDGATEGDVMALGGWRSREMLDRYGSVARTERAIEAHRRLSPADRLRKR